MIRMETTPAQIGIETQPGGFEIRQRPAEIHMRTTPGKFTFHDSPGKLEIDVSRVWEAFHGGSPLDITKRIYSQIPEIVRQAIVKIVEKGNRMAAVHLPGNPIQEIAYQSLFEDPIPIQYTGPASYDNIDIRYTVEDFRSEFEPWEVQVDVETHRPEITFHRWQVDVYMKQYPSLRIIPPRIDLEA
jgi:hypothetical protein